MKQVHPSFILIRTPFLQMAVEHWSFFSPAAYYLNYLARVYFIPSSAGGGDGVCVQPGIKFPRPLIGL